MDPGATLLGIDFHVARWLGLVTMNETHTAVEKNRRILVIDDNKGIHDDFQKVLSASGHSNLSLDAARAKILSLPTRTLEQTVFELDFALQGQEGLELVREAAVEGRPYAMAFVDMRMPPGWDGLETIAHLWDECPELQIVICTAYSDYSWEQIVQKLGYSDQLLVLKKPFDNIEVRQLAYALTEKWHLARQASLKMDDLGRMVQARTAELERAHDDLTAMNETLSVAKIAAEEANRSKSQFLANVSHEIRTPMTAILGYAELLYDEESLSETAPGNADALHTIVRNGEHLLGVIDDILDLSNIETGKLEVKAVPCEPVEIISDAIAELKRQARQKGLSLTSEFTGPIPRTIRTDPARLRQILLNLIDNAIKFTEKGSVRLQTGLADDQGDGPRLQFDVIDTGIGVTKAQTATLFSPFVQADSSATRRY